MRKRSFCTAEAFGLACVAAWLAGCSAQSASSLPSLPTAQSPLPPVVPKPPPAPSPQGHVTMASWYGPGFYGRRTSSGEVYKRHSLTAASLILPLGSHVRVTNLSNGRSVVVRINDRGPYVPGRDIDLSHRAAQQIGLDRSGVAPVQIAHADETASTTLAPSLPAERWNGQLRVRHHAPRHRRHTYHSRYVHRRRRLRSA